LVQSVSGKPQLFNLSRDIGESKDVNQQYPQKCKELQSLYEQWNSQLAEPRWQKEKKATPKNRKKNPSESIVIIDKL